MVVQTHARGLMAAASATPECLPARVNNAAPYRQVERVSPSIHAADRQVVASGPFVVDASRTTNANET